MSKPMAPRPLAVTRPVAVAARRSSSPSLDHHKVVDYTQPLPIPAAAPSSLRQLPKKQRNIAVACQACQHRRRRCTGERPTCQSCSVKGTPCIYDLDPSKSRPEALKQKIRDLQLEIERLKGLALKNGSPTITFDDYCLFNQAADHSFKSNFTPIIALQPAASASFAMDKTGAATEQVYHDHIRRLGEALAERGAEIQRLNAHIVRLTGNGNVDGLATRILVPNNTDTMAGEAFSTQTYKQEEVELHGTGRAHSYAEHDGCSSGSSPISVAHASMRAFPTITYQEPWSNSSSLQMLNMSTAIGSDYTFTSWGHQDAPG